MTSEARQNSSVSKSIHVHPSPTLALVKWPVCDLTLVTSIIVQTVNATHWESSDSLPLSPKSFTEQLLSSVKLQVQLELWLTDNF